MQVRGTVISFENNVQVAKNGGGNYLGGRLAYRDEAGSMKEKAFHSNVFKFNAVLLTQLSNLNAGQEFIMTMEKEGEFWNVKSVLPTDSTNAPQATTNQSSTVSVNKGTPVPYAAPKSNYETPEERAKKQVYIVRQSTINQALEYTKLVSQTDKKLTYNVKSILDTAKQFEAHVFGEKYDDGTILDMTDDTDGIV